MRPLALAMLAALLAHAAAAQPGPPPAGDANRGRAIYLDDACYQCHGRIGQGGPGPAVASTRMPFAGFERQMRKPIRSMPPYSPNVLPAQDLADVYAYLKSLPGAPAKLPAILSD